ncbi:MAG: phosphoserine phosphatase SerB [Burkholderiales bacterium]|nr:phosphoserine phosphatase SerB [Burkholderiales bacterium]
MTYSHLLLQAARLPPGFLERVASLAGVTACNRLSDTAWRLTGSPELPPSRWTAIQSLCEAERVDVARIERQRALADFRLAVMDMDSTLITIECIDEIADMLGIKPAVSAITESAMRGEIDYPESLRRRVGLLKGLDAAALERVYHERLRLSPGAETLVAGLHAAGITTILVSGGFTFFADKVKARLGLGMARANTLEIADGRLTGKVIGDIVDGEAKRRELLAACARLGCSSSAAIAIGDGANDLAMMGVAGVSIAYRAKPVVRARASFAISHNGLEAILPLFAA